MDDVASGMKHAIRLESLSREGRVLKCAFSSSLDVFARRDFFVEYGRDLSDAPDGALAMPFVGIMMPVAWASGADLVLPAVDAAFAESLGRAAAYWRKCYPRWKFDEARLVADPREDRPDASRHGLLFSGGLDSLASYARHRRERLSLYTVIGADFPYGERGFAEMCKERLFGEFARNEGADLSYIHTNVSDVLDLKRLSRYASNWYGAVQHGLMLASLVAPAAPDLKRLYFASCSHKPDSRFPCGSAPEVVRGLRWRSAEAADDLNDLNRAEKIGRHLKPQPELLRYLRTCWVQHQEMNCSRCEKCLRTICELLLNNLDPNEFNFRVDSSTLERLKFRMTRRYYLFYRGNEGVINFWRAIQESVDLGALEDIHGSRRFFEWLAGYDQLRRPQNRLLVSFWLSALDARDAAKRMLPKKSYELQPNY